MSNLNENGNLNENENEWEWETADGFETETKGSKGSDSRPTWAKKIQGHHHNYEQLDRIKRIVGDDVADDADICIKTRKVRIGDRSYTTDVFLNGKVVGNYSY